MNRRNFHRKTNVHKHNLWATRLYKAATPHAVARFLLATVTPFRYRPLKATGVSTPARFKSEVAILLRGIDEDLREIDAPMRAQRQGILLARAALKIHPGPRI